MSLTLLFRCWPRILLDTLWNSVILPLIPFTVLSDMDRAVHRSVVQLCENLGFVELGHGVGN